MAQYAVLIYANDSAHAPEATASDTESCDEHADALVDAGSMLLAYALTPRDMATSLRAGTVTDGTFMDTKEIVAGFYVIEAADLDAALAIASTNPVIREGGGVEVRPVHSGGVVQIPGAERSAIDSVKASDAAASPATAAASRG